MTDPLLALARLRAEDRLKFAVQALEAARQVLEADSDSDLANAAFQQAVTEAEDALAVAYELGMDTNERNR